MFDEQPTQFPVQPPANLPTEPDDMFSGVEKDQPEGPTALEAGLLKKKESPTSDGSLRDAPIETMPLEEDTPPDARELYPAKAPILGKIFLVLVVVAVAGGAGYGGWRIFANYSGADKTVTPQTNNGPAVTPQVQMPAGLPDKLPEPAPVSPSTNTASADMNSDKILFGEPIDTDKDGLDDVREGELGTDINKPDTDNDGLSDGDEAIIWKTDPLNPDTDNDSYLDGEEVSHGYNPLGPGKLFPGQGQAPAATTATSSK